MKNCIYRQLKRYKIIVLIDENSKNTNNLKWVGLMNNYKHSFEDIILLEVIL